MNEKPAILGQILLKTEGGKTRNFDSSNQQND